MSIDDDYFDVRSELEGKPEEKLFLEFITRYSEMEALIENLDKQNSILSQAIRIVSNEDEHTS